MVEPKDLVRAMSKTFYDEVESDKWKERKEALTKVRDIAAHPRLVAGDFGDLCREVKKVGRG